MACSCNPYGESLLQLQANTCSAPGCARWCAKCAKPHAGAVAQVGRKMCEDCKKIAPTYGLRADDGSLVSGGTGGSLSIRRW